jgi:transcription factor SPN1
MSKPDNQNWFVTYGGLSVIRTWLQPSPDGTLPALTLRNELLRVLQKLPVSASNLRKSKLGHEIKALLKREDETLQNRKICQDLITRWLSLVLDVQNSIRTQRAEQQHKLENSAKPVKKKRKTRAEIIAHEKEVQERRHPQMFQKPSHSFKVAPQYEVHSLAADAAGKRQTRKGKIAKCAGELRALRPSEKHEHVSIANFQNRFS